MSRHLREPSPRRPRGAVALGVLGELMMTVGVLLGLFVVWQLWWTDVTAGHQQQEVVENLDWAVDTSVPVDQPEPEPEPDPEPTDPGPPPVPEEPEHAETFATLRVPRWGADYVRPVSQGTTRTDVLDVLGIGHYDGTAMPGEVGNFSLAAHRTTYNKPFNRVEELEVGDPLVIQTEEAWYVYRVVGTTIVLPHEVDVIAPVPGEPEAEPTARMMTLTTCHPMFSARERFIVHTELAEWMPVGDGVPEALTEDAATAAVDPGATDDQEDA